MITCAQTQKVRPALSHEQDTADCQGTAAAASCLALSWARYLFELVHNFEHILSTAQLSMHL